MPDFRSQLIHENDYRVIIKALLKNTRGPKITLKKLSEHIGVQYTYLSKALNCSDVHLSEDHLFKIADLFKLSEFEEQYLYLLRQRDVTGLKQREQAIAQRIKKVRETRFLETKKEDCDATLVMQLTGFDFLYHMGLHIHAYRNEPLMLGRALGMTDDRSMQCLKFLESINLITLKKNPIRVVEHYQFKTHFPPHHPATRWHQTIMRQLVGAQLIKLKDDDKDCFTATFTADDQAFIKIKTLLRETSQIIRDLSQNSRDVHVFHLGWDLCYWDR